MGEGSGAISVAVSVEGGACKEMGLLVAGSGWSAIAMRLAVTEAILALAIYTTQEEWGKDLEDILVGEKLSRADANYSSDVMEKAPKGLLGKTCAGVEVRWLLVEQTTEELGLPQANKTCNSRHYIPLI